MQSDWLWYYLKRLPANEALLRAVEARLLTAVDLPQPILDLRLRSFAWEQAYGSVIAEVQQTSPTQLQTIAEHLDAGATLVMLAPVGTEASTVAQLVNWAGFEVERWFPYFSAEAQAVYEAENSLWPHLLHEATGHYVIPWRSLLNSAERRLRPVYIAEAEPTDTGQYNCFICRKRGNDKIEQELPAPEPLTLQVEAPAIDYPTVSKPIRQRRTPSQRRTLNFVAFTPLLVIIALVSAYFGQNGLRDNPTMPQFGWFAVTLAAMLGISWLARPATENAERTSAWHEWLTPPLLVRFGATVTALLLSLFASALSEQPVIALPLWLIAIFVGVSALHKRAESATSTGSGQAENTPSHLNRYAPFGIALVALIIRYVGLTSHPFMVNGIETQMGLDALVVDEAFGSAWLTNPTLPLFFTKSMIAIFGRTPLALRILSPIGGALTILAIYHIGRQLWSQRVGLAAAILLAGSHLHLHYSRLGMSHVWDTLFVLGAMGGIGMAWHTRQRTAWLWAGAAIGLSAYTFTSAHLVPLMLVAAIAICLLLNWSGTSTQWQHIAMGAIVALIVALPQVRHYNAERNLFMERANVLGITRNGWLEQHSGDDNSVLATQFWQAALAFNATNDEDAVYNPGRPFLGTLAGVLFLIGVGMAIFHLRQMRYAVLLITVGITVVFGGALLVDPPHSRRLVVALPAAILLAARALVWLVEKGVAKRQRWWMPLVVAVAVLIAVGDMAFYFGRYRTDNQTNPRFGDRNTEIAFEVANLINELEGEWTVYFYGAPTMFTSFSTIPFLAPDYVQGANLWDVTDATDLTAANTDNTIHIYLPERSADIAITQSAFPNGTSSFISGAYADPLFTIYKVSR